MTDTAKRRKLSHEILGLIGLSAVVLERLSKGNEKKSLLSQILASVSLIVGMLNAFA